ncbi:membrane protein insertase YidC [Thiocystis violascens]|uniref:Membrane protein insertase YidC n=1 Tax=Thiocystis violascens (strain ATCC 17096 / DSM 198 / 6111) TaxID=765911 RepID=I3YD26_THIV6|nr:membrane protein insertase YidC [Thiocystis violascens]AFL74894.1 protein translocase subunit yidC [Thiocystis violascens DSM 198]
MDNQRLILFFSLAAVLFLIYESWMQDYGRPSVPQVAQEQGQTAAFAPKTTQKDIPAIATTPDMVATGAAMEELARQENASPRIVVETDLLKVEISTRGGTIGSAWLLDYATVPERPEDKLQLLKPVAPNMFIVQSGLLGEDVSLLPTHEGEFHSAQSSYRLEPGVDHLDVDLTWRNEAGIEVKKRYTFTRGSYVVQTRQIVTNATDAPLVAREYNQLQRTDFSDPNESRFIKNYTGGAFYSPEDKYRKVSFKEMLKGKLDQPVVDGWIAMMQHYFIAAWIPPRGEQDIFYTKVLDNSRYIIGKYSPALSIAPGTTHEFSNQLFIGPTLQDDLASVATGLDLAIDYGWLTVIAQPIHWVLSAIHSVVGNWGWSIIFLTILIKLAFYKLSETSYKSMANMRQLTPRMQALKDRYGDDKQRLNQAMMEMYKTEKINPLGGCLPILIQIPVFIALYWVLLSSVEMRQAPFMLWLDNLSAPDPYFVLPLIMGVSMYIQQKLNPAPPDPMQAKIMMSLPFVFTVFFAFFPSGLVLYWVVNNLLSIAQQWHITRNIEKVAAKHKR